MVGTGTLTQTEQRALEHCQDAGSVTSAELAAALGVSQGHASRMLRRVMTIGLLQVELGAGGVLVYSSRGR